jgi:hypothetical protein
MTNTKALARRSWGKLRAGNGVRCQPQQCSESSVDIQTNTCCYARKNLGELCVWVSEGTCPRMQNSIDAGGHLGPAPSVLKSPFLPVSACCQLRCRESTNLHASRPVNHQRESEASKISLQVISLVSWITTLYVRTVRKKQSVRLFL